VVAAFRADFAFGRNVVDGRWERRTVLPSTSMRPPRCLNIAMSEAMVSLVRCRLAATGERRLKADALLLVVALAGLLDAVDLLDIGAPLFSVGRPSAMDAWRLR